MSTNNERNNPGSNTTVWKVNCWSGDTDDNRERQPGAAGGPFSFWLNLEPGKKASHIAGSDQDSLINTKQQEAPLQHLLATEGTPPHVTIDCQQFSTHDTDSSSCPLLFGGLEIISQARTIEAYGTSLQGKEAYIATGRGAKVDASLASNITKNNEEPSNDGSQIAPLYNTVVLSPGGPQRVMKVKLKLLGLSKQQSDNKNEEQIISHTPSTSLPRASIFFLKVKGRILEPIGPANPVAMPGQTPFPSSSHRTLPGSFASTTMPPGTMAQGNASFPGAGMPMMPQFQHTPHKQASISHSNLPTTSAHNASYSVATSSDVHSAITAITLIAKSMESSLQQSIQKVDRRMTEIEEKVNNLQTHIQMSHQSSMQHRVQLVQLQNQYLMKEMKEMKEAILRSQSSVHREESAVQPCSVVEDHDVDSVANKGSGESSDTRAQSRVEETEKGAQRGEALPDSIGHKMIEVEEEVCTEGNTEDNSEIGSSSPRSTPPPTSAIDSRRENDNVNETAVNVKDHECDEVKEEESVKSSSVKMPNEELRGDDPAKAFLSERSEDKEGNSVEVYGVTATIVPSDGRAQADDPCSTDGMRDQKADDSMLHPSQEEDDGEKNDPLSETTDK
jgi:hypothetical protein